MSRAPPPSPLLFDRQSPSTPFRSPRSKPLERPGASTVVFLERKSSGPRKGVRRRTLRMCSLGSARTKDRKEALGKRRRVGVAPIDADRAVASRGAGPRRSDERDSSRRALTNGENAPLPTRGCSRRQGGQRARQLQAEKGGQGAFRGMREESKRAKRTTARGLGMSLIESRDGESQTRDDREQAKLKQVTNAGRETGKERACDEQVPRLTKGQKERRRKKERTGVERSQRWTSLERWHLATRARALSVSRPIVGTEARAFQDLRSDALVRLLASAPPYATPAPLSSSSPGR